MCAVPPAVRRLAALVVTAALVTGCSGSSSPKPAATPSASLPSLPPGALREQVLQPGEVSPTLAPIAAQTGARDITSIAAFSADPKAAKKTLEKHGFQSAYVVQYADPASSAVVTNVVTKFATVEGATADLTGDLGQSAKTGTPYDVTGLGDQAGGVRGKFSPESVAGTLVMLRWRVGDTTWLLAVGAPKPVDEGGVRRLADALLARIGSAD
jgi:hypothetical protein